MFYNICKSTIKIIRFSSLFFFVVVYILYYLSLEKCVAGQVRCSLNIKWIEKKLHEGVACAIILMILFEFIILRIIILIIYCVFLIIFSISFEFYLANFLGCNEWPKGLNNTYIENDIKYGCIIKIPKYCPYKFLGYFLDITRRLGINCTKTSNTKKKIIEFSKTNQINKNTKRIGFPLTNQVEFWGKKSNGPKQIQNIVREYLINMDKIKKKKNIYKKNFPEVIVDFSKNEEGNMNVNLHFNKLLSIKRKKMEINYHPYSNNIMILYFDSVSI